MSTTRPTDTPDWASALSGGSELTEPPANKQGQGWLDFERPPAAFANWMANRFSIWVQHFASVSSLFTTMEDAFRAPPTAPLVIGDSFWVDEADGGLPGTVVVATVFPGIGAIERIDVGGDFVVVAANDGGGDLTIELAERDGSGLISTIAPSATALVGTCERILTDGIDIVVIYTVTAGSVVTVECFTAATGASKWTATPMVGGGAIIRDMAWDETHVYVVGDDPGRELIALDRSTGAEVYAYDHSGVAVARLNSVGAAGLYVFVGGRASGHASGATVRGLIASNGFDNTGEGGLGTDARAWNIVGGAETIAGNSLAADGKRIYVAEAADVVSRGAGDGVLINTAVGAGAAKIVVDQDYVFINEFAFTKDLSMVWTSAVFGRVASDGAAVFSTNGTRLARGNYGPARFRRIDPATQTFVAIRNALTPTDIA